MTSDGGAAGEVTEHRMALVMNGGVSLAVWMGGVAREIDNARRASNGLPPAPDADEHQRRTHELWAAATKAARVRVSVDVIAGTSAGGLNGVLLAASIARGAPLAGLRGLWMRAGQLSDDALLRPQTEPQSLMDGQYFRDQIAQALQLMTAQPEEQRRPVSLIVTSTALGRSVRPVVDSAGRCFTEADHRRRFHFTRHAPRSVYEHTEDGWTLRPGPAVDHFDTTDAQTCDALASAARATASFPVAFAPVRETPALRRRRVWPDWATDDAPDWLADGGILDNSPFGPVLESVEHKPVDGAWRRTVCYVDPSADDRTPDTLPDPPADESVPPPSWLAVALSALTLPSEIDFRDDVEQLHQTVRAGRSSLDVRRFRSLTTGEHAQRDLGVARGICTQALPLYRQSCTAAAIYEVRDILARGSADGYLTPALATDKDLPLYPGPRPWLPAGFPAAGDQLPTTWDWGLSAATRVLRTVLRSTSPAAQQAPDTELRAQLSGAIDDVTAIGYALDARLVEAAAGPAPADAEILTLLDEAYTDLDVPTRVAQVVAGAVTAYAQAMTPPLQPVDVLSAALAIEASNGSGSLPGSTARPLFDFDRLGLDTPPPLLQSAYSQAFDGEGAPSRNNILYGSRLNHFAAFAKQEWREWDWLWGRMNALAHLAQLLGLADDAVDELTRAVLAEEGHDVDSVTAGIATVAALDKSACTKELTTGGSLPPAVDGALSLLRSDPQTAPLLPRPLVTTGRLVSDVLARNGHQRKVHHPVLRGLTGAGRAVLWRHFEKKG